VWLRRIALVVALCMVAACAPAATGFAPGASVHRINVGGVDRGYRLYVPEDLPPSAPLVLMLHGWTGSAEQAQRQYGWNGKADSAKFVVAYPDGIGESWNVDECCGKASEDKVDDVGFITAAVQNITEHLDIDKTRIYAAGISNGGIMAYKLACNTDLFAAIGPDAATLLAACPTPHPTSVLHIHGTDDRLVRYDGQPGTVLPVPTMTPPDVNAFWRNVDQCEPPTTTVDGDLTTSLANCPSGRSVELITVAGGEHDWPSFATEKMWDFFAAHPRPPS
jgi:polyhydroxybutyrate depolymerase